MKFKVKDHDDGALAVHVERDGADIDIVVTDSKGEEFTVAFLNGDGLTICTLYGDTEEIAVGLDGRIVYQDDQGNQDDRGN